MKKIIVTSLICLTMLVGNLYAQIADSSINMYQVGINYGFHLPYKNMADRFGVSSTIGLSFDYKFKSNWSLGLEYNYIFGSNIKDSSSMLTGLMTESGQIINMYGEYGTFVLSERGFYSGGRVSKIIPVLGPNKNSGIIISFGAGLLQHHIHIENKDNNTPPILGDYKKGYDKLCNGFSAKQFIGYQYLDNRGLINFYFGFELYEAWTMSRRDYDFDIMGYDDTKRKDVLGGIRVGWILPLYQKAPDKFYYY